MEPEKPFRPALDATELQEGEVPDSRLRTRRGRFIYQGEPVYPIGSGLEAFRQDNGYDGLDIDAWKSHIDLLASLQTPHVRFRLRFGAWAFCWDEAALCPWQRTGTGYDLAAFDTDFWQRLRQVAEYAREKGLLLEFILFDTFALQHGQQGKGWGRHPFNATNGGPLAESHPSRSFYNLAAPNDYLLFQQPFDPAWPVLTQLQYHQQRWAMQAIDCLDGLENVVWELVSDMDASDPVRVGFVSHFIQFLRRNDPQDRLAGLSVETLNRTDAVYFRLTGVDAVNFHWDGAEGEPHAEFAETIAGLASYGKPVVANQAGWPHGDPCSEKWERWSFWQAFVAGGHPVADCARSFRRRPVHDWLKVFAQFVEETDFPTLVFAPGVIRRIASDVQAHAAISDTDFVLYMTTDAPQDGAGIVLGLPEGQWSGHWFDPRTGNSLDTLSLTTARAEVMETRTPTFDEDVALHLRRQETE